MSDLKQNPASVVELVRSTGVDYQITVRGHPVGVRLVPDATPPLHPPQGGISSDQIAERRNFRRQHRNLSQSEMSDWAIELQHEREMYPFGSAIV
jgi:antitoxin (DNA-binding transcriptional repressor) of toxin-antitoxin stability system